jgi:hypothetical protein
MNVVEIDPTEFGRQIGEIIRASTDQLAQRIELLESDLQTLITLVAELEGSKA